MMGREVANQNVNTSIKATFDLSQQAKGMYTVIATDGKTTKTEKSEKKKPIKADKS